MSSKVFLNSHRGPYRRNIVNDEVNEFEEEGDVLTIFKSLVSLIVFGLIFFIMGLIFLGFRKMLISIFENMAGLQLGFLSFPHILSYMLFFLLVDLLRYLVIDKIIEWLIKLKNPPTDESARQMAHNLKFFFLLGIELIPPFFFLVLEPFMRTTCYSSSCIDEMIFYVYSRYIIILGESIFRALKMAYSQSK